MVHRVFHKKASVQRLIIKISTEEELVDVSEYLPYNLWLINFSRVGIWNNNEQYSVPIQPKCNNYG